MALPNYPNNPTVGQRFTLPSGVIMECVEVGATPRWKAYDPRLNAEVVKQIAFVDELRTREGSFNGEAVQLVSYYAGANKGGGVFVWDAASTAADDGGVTIAVAGVATGRWVRQLDGYVTPEIFGAKGDGINDDYIAVSAAWQSGYKVEQDSAAIYALSENMSVNCAERDLIVNFNGSDFLFTGASSGGITVFGGFSNETPVTATSTSTITVAIGSPILADLASRINDNPLIKIVADDLINEAAGAQERVGEFCKVASVNAGTGVITIRGKLHNAYTITPRVFTVKSGQVVINGYNYDVTNFNNTNTSVFFQGLIEPKLIDPTIKKNGVGGIVTRSCYKTKIVRPQVGYLRDESGSGRFGYGVSDNASMFTHLVGGDFYYTRHAYTSNAGTTAVNGPPQNYGQTMFARIESSRAYCNSGVSWDTHPNDYGVESVNNASYNSLAAGFNVRGLNTKIINPISEGDAFGIRAGGFFDGLSISNPIVRNCKLLPLLFEGVAGGRQSVEIDGGSLNGAYEGNEIARLTNTDIKFNTTRMGMFSLTNYAKVIMLENAKVKGSLVVDAASYAQATLRLFEVRNSTTSNDVYLSNLDFDFNSATTFGTLILDTTSSGLNKFVVENATLPIITNSISGVLSAGSGYTAKAQNGDATNNVRITITASNQGIAQLSYLRDRHIRVSFNNTSGLSRLIGAIPAGRVVGQQLDIYNVKSGFEIVIQHGPSFNTDLISAANTTIPVNGTMRLIWDGTLWVQQA